MTERERDEALREAGRMLVERLFEEEVLSVDIVFCKDCKYWLPHTQRGYDADYDECHNYCAFHMPDDEWYAEYWDADDYCSYGERKENKNE